MVGWVVVSGTREVLGSPGVTQRHLGQPRHGARNAAHVNGRVKCARRWKKHRTGCVHGRHVYAHRPLDRTQRSDALDTRGNQGWHIAGDKAKFGVHSCPRSDNSSILENTGTE